MKETELKLHPCYCGGEMELKKVAQNGGMDGTYWEWELTCKKCGLTMTYAADGFYGRKYKTFEEVIDDWNRNKKKEKIIKADVLDKIRAEIAELQLMGYAIVNGKREIASKAVMHILDKYKKESENK